AQSIAQRPAVDRTIVARKDGALYGAAAALGALSAGADPARTAAYERLGAALGAALALRDAASRDAVDARAADLGLPDGGPVRSFLAAALANGYAVPAANPTQSPLSQ
ncbi:MAG TPA: hypothetical protein VGN14_13250, partial [Candidatus Elarobacter sp.]